MTKRLEAPDFSALHPEHRFVAGVRPHRGGGMRIALGKPLEVDGRRQIVVHNYGHGGAGLSLAFAAADTTRDLVVKSAGERIAPSIAVIGAGVIGLTTARTLRERWPAATITVYARDTKPAATTSYWAGGQFAVATSLDEYHSTEERQLLHRHLEASERHLAKLVATGRAARYGIARRTAYTPRAQGDVRLMLGASSMIATSYSAWLIDPTRLLPALHEDLSLAGVRVVAREFESRSALTALPEDIIVNCTGAGAATLFDDAAMRPCRGHLVLLQNPKRLDYFLNSWCGGNRIAHIFARHDDIVLGGSIQWEPTGDQFDPENPVDVRICERILRNARGVFAAQGDGKCAI